MHHDIADEFEAEIIGRNRGHLWEQVDLPLYMAKKSGAPLLNFANTAPFLYGNNFITIHDLAFYHHPEWNARMFSAWYNSIVPRLARKSRHIFTVSETMRNELIQYYHLSGSKISVTYNGISQRMLSAPKQATKEKIILSVGSFNARKNHHQLVKAFLESHLKDDYQLVLVGDKNKVFSEVKTLTSYDLSLAHNVKIYQNFTDEQLISMYQRAEIVVSLSAYEGFGIPLLEGLYSGCKIVCSDIPVYREIYEGYAVFCDPDDTGNIIDGINKATKTSFRDLNVPASLFDKYNYQRSAEVILKNILSV